MNLESHLKDFFSAVGKNEIEIYNEFSLQHELGVFLRSRLEGSKVQFERNVAHFSFEKSLFEKKEIDISITDSINGNLLAVIELKFPRNGQVPESMYSFCKDIAFLEQLAATGFQAAYFLALADDPAFYSGKPDGIYGLFRNGRPISGIIQKPTGAKDSHVSISGEYAASWHAIANGMKYCLIRVAGND